MTTDANIQKELQIFNNPNFGNVRALEIDNSPYFVGRDIAACLGYVKPENAIRQHVDNEDTLKQGIPDNQGFTQSTTLVNESGVYSLVFGSKLETAKEFKKWVTKDVLPSIRKHGAYMTPQKIEEAILNPDTIIQLATTLKEEKQKRIEAEAKRIEAESRSEAQSKLISEIAPKADYYDKTLVSSDTMTTTQIAKELGMSCRVLNTRLKDLGVQYKVNGQWLLYAKYQHKEYTKPYTYTETINGESRSFVSTVWTQKGREFIHSLIKSKITV